MAIGLSIGCALFGIAWAKFLVYFGVGLLVLSVGRLVLELRAERARAGRRSATRERDDERARRCLAACLALGS